MKLVSYIQDTCNELVHNVTWPTWQELQNNTILVVTASIILSLTIFAMDKVFGNDPNFVWNGVLGFVYNFF
ncbi:MAG: preprotein translocase subunit SecE [Crocinitomicaceae bacterium]